MLWPVDLAIPYPHYGYGDIWLFCGSAALVLAIGFAALRFGPKFPFLVTGWLWYFGMLVPVIGLVQVGMQSMADRYTYLPSVGIFIVIAWGAGEMVERSRLPRYAITVVAVLILAVCAGRTWNQLGFWRDSKTLFSHSIAVTEGNAIAQYNLGTYLCSRGQFEEAIDHLRAALLIKPSYDDALNNLASALAANGEPGEAASVFRDAVRRQPGRADVHYNFANVLAMQHKLDEAVSEYNESLSLNPDDARAHNNLGNVLLMQGHKEEAAQQFREALRINPNHSGAKQQLEALEKHSP